MDFLALKDIAERDMHLINPSSPDKVLAVGRHLGLKAGDRIIDFGCGFAEPLALWAEAFGISGIGIDIRPYACERARQRLAACHASDRIEILCARGTDYTVLPHSFDAAVCLGATFVFGGFGQTLDTLKQAIIPGGAIAVGEPYRRNAANAGQPARNFHTETELCQIARTAGLDIAAIVRSTEADWDNYQTANWRGYQRWLRENPGHPDWQAVERELFRDQDDYLGFERESLGWAMYVLTEHRKR